MRDHADARINRAMDVALMAASERRGAADVIGMVVGDQNAAQSQIGVPQSSFNDIGIARINRQRVALPVVQQPQIVVRECGQSDDIDFMR